MINAMFCTPGEYLNPESVLDQYLEQTDELSLLVGCPHCRSLNIKIVDIESRRLTICSDCGDVSDSPPAN